MKVCLNDKDALIVVDVQNDFLPGGALAVGAGDSVLKPLNEYIKRFDAKGLPVFFTRDWHPLNHLSFRDNGGVWPQHCVMETAGAAFPATLVLPADNKYIISKGCKHEFDAYSGFQDTLLATLLRERGIRRVFIGGLATNYCVKSTVEGALNLGFETVLLLDGCKGIDLQPGDSDKAVDKMLTAGAFGVMLPDLADV